jgi:pyruvate dehydrogenase E2 component (dihydrolipoamide acetyltransferase)
VAIEVIMPQMGADMTEGTLVRWLKQVGEHVNRGEVIAEIETDKATVELESYESGTVLQHVTGEGETVPVGDIIALLGAPGEAVQGAPARRPPAETPVRRTIDRAVETVLAPEPLSPLVAPMPATEVPPAPGPNGAVQAIPALTPGGRLRVSPVARRIAHDAGVDIATLQGSGPDGRILRRDVEAAVKSRGAVAAAPTPVAAPAPAAVAPRAPVAAAPAGGEVQPLSKMRQAIARRMVLSKQQQPHYYLTLDIDMTAALGFREQLNATATAEQRVSVNDLVVKACALALQRHPRFNAAYGDAGLQFHDRVNIDIGIALDEGLIAPAILDCGNKSLGRIAVEAKDLIERAKSGHLRSDEYTDGTFTITNLGAYGVETLIGIINPPQAAILGVGSVMPQPVVRDGEVVVRQVMKVALSADHRVTDGAEGARFIKEIQGLLENPASLAL